MEDYIFLCSFIIFQNISLPHSNDKTKIVDLQPSASSDVGLCNDETLSYTWDITSSWVLLVMLECFMTGSECNPRLLTRSNTEGHPQEWRSELEWAHEQSSIFWSAHTCPNIGWNLENFTATLFVVLTHGTEFWLQIPGLAEWMLAPGNRRSDEWSGPSRGRGPDRWSELRSLLWLGNVWDVSSSVWRHQAGVRHEARPSVCVTVSFIMLSTQWPDHVVCSLLALPCRAPPPGAPSAVTKLHWQYEYMGAGSAKHIQDD